VVDWFFDALNNFVTFMNDTGPVEFLGLIIVVEIGVVALVAVHEFGHACAAWARGLRVRSVQVGPKPMVTFSVGSTQIELGWTLTLASGRAGQVDYDAERATPTDVLLVTAAGPAASVVGGLVCTALAAALSSHEILSVALGLLAVKTFAEVIYNLAPLGDGPETWSDGRWIAESWQARRGGGGGAVRAPKAQPVAAASQPVALSPNDPNRATSVAPPPRG
jgi:hypothetical protein